MLFQKLYTYLFSSTGFGFYCNLPLITEYCFRNCDLVVDPGMWKEGQQKSKHVVRNHLEKIRPSQISCVMNGSGHGSLEMLGQTIVARNMCRRLSYLLIVVSCSQVFQHK